MQFFGSPTSTDATYKQGICDEVDSLCDSDNTSYPREVKTRRANISYKEVVNWLINADGFWQFDDSNITDQPRGKGTLVEGQEIYTFASDYLQIEEMDVLDLDGITYRKLKSLDQADLGDNSPDEYFGLDTDGTPKTGMPEYYDLITDDSFRLYPSPGATYCTLTNGLRVWFKRNPTLFTVATGTTEDTTEPGFAVHHEILAYMMALPFCMSYKKDRVVLYKQIILDLKQAILDHYEQRDKDHKKKLTMKSTSYQ
jgi:hypothetical protein